MPPAPEQKKCPACGETKPASEFHKDKSRKDGLKYSCKKCVGTSKNYKKRTFGNYKKVCAVCSRSLAAKWFVYSSREDDGLELRCRTCRSWCSRSTTPTIDEVVAYEEQIDNIVQSATMQLLRTYDKGSLNETIAEHRSEFEQLCVVGFQRSGLGGSWKMPIWIHSSSIP